MVYNTDGDVEIFIAGASKSKPGLAGIGGMLRDSTDEALIFSKKEGVHGSNKVDVLTILKALLLLPRGNQEVLLME